MAITPPNYQKDAIPTPRGWTHPRTGELLKAQKLSQQQIDEYCGEVITTAPVTLTESPTTEEEFAAEHIEVEIEEITEEEYDEDEDWSQEELSAMTKAELVEFAAEYGIELSSSMTKAEMIEELSEYDLED